MESALPCSPWDRWVLVALHRHADRQRFVEQIVRERLSGLPERLAAAGWSGHPEGPGAGEVPGMPAWHYRFHGRGCCLTHEDGTELDVDFDEHGSASVDPGFYQAFLASAPELDWPECSLRDTEGGWKASIHPLRDAGLLDGEHRIRVVPHAVEWCEAVSQAVDEARGSDARLLGVALAIEDFSLAAKLYPSSRSLRAAAEQQLENQCSELERRIHARLGSHVESCVAALRSLDGERARAAALTQLRDGAIDAVLAASMELLADDPHPGDIPAIHTLLGRLHGFEPPVPRLRIRAARHLLAPFRRATVPDELRSLLLATLADDQRASEGEAALIVYLLDVERGLARMRAGLSSSIPLVRDECAAALASVGDAD